MFKFSLQTALTVRGREEKMRMKDLAVKLVVEQDIQKNIAHVEHTVSTSDQNLNEAKKAGAVTVEQMRQLVQFKDWKKRELTLLQQQLEDAQKDVVIQRECLQKARKAKKTMEILKDRELKQYREEIARQERHFMDEAAGTLHQKKRSFKAG
jgi:flagellar FliJ protein